MAKGPLSHLNTTAGAYLGVFLLTTLFLGLPALIRGPVFGPVDLLNHPAIDRYLFQDVMPKHIHNGMLSDQLDFVMPYYVLVRENLRRGKLPLWNRYNGNGVPLLANLQSGTFSPQVLLSLGLPLRYAYLFQVFLSLLILGTGMVFFFRSMGVSPLISLVGAVSFQFSGPIVVWLGWPHLRVLCWIGWVLGLLVTSLKGRRPLLSSALLGLTVAFLFLGGHPQSMLMVACSVVAFLPSALWIWLKGDSSPKRVLLPLAGGFLGVLVGMVQYLPALPLIQESFMRASRAASSSKGVVTGTPLRYLDLYLFPYLFGSWKRFVGPSNYIELTSYVGIIPVLAPLGILRCLNPLSLFGILLSTLSFLIAFHTPLLPNLKGFGVLGTPHRFVMLLNLGMVVLAVAALEEMVRSSRTSRLLLVLFSILLIASVGYGVFTLMQPPLFPKIYHVRFWSVLSWVVPISLMALCSLACVVEKMEKEWMIGAILTFQVLWLFGYGIFFNTFGKTFFPNSPVVSEVKKVVGDERTSWIAPSQFWPNTNIPYHISILSVHESLIPASWVNLLHILEPQQISSYQLTPSFIKTSIFFKLSTYRIMGVKYLVVPPSKSLPSTLSKEATRIHSSDKIAVYLVKRSETYGVSVRCTKDSSQEILKNPSETIANMAEGRLALIDESGYTACLGIMEIMNKDGNATLEILRDRWKNNNIEEVDVKLTQPSLLVRKVLYSPGWSVRVDGKKANLYRVNGAFQGVVLEAGTHRLRFRYWPKFLSLGLALGITGLAVLMVMLLTGLFQKEREEFYG